MRGLHGPVCFMLLGCCLATAAHTPALAKEQSSSFRLEVPAGRWKVARFRGLPQHGSLTVAVTTSGPVEILLFDLERYRRFPGAEDPLFRGRTADKFGFSVKVPKSGDYFLVIDNRGGARPCRLSIDVKAASADHPAPRRPRDLESANRQGAWTMAGDPLELAGIGRATVSPDGETVGLSLVDLENHEYDVSLTFEGLGRTIVKLLAVAETAGAQRRNSGMASDPPLPHADALLPFPVARYALGLSEDRTQVVLRLVSDADLIWDFVLPLDSLRSLQSDLSRLETLAKRGEA